MTDKGLLRTRVDSNAIGKELLIYGSCIREEYPEILNKYGGMERLHVCLEEHHINKIAWKILTLARVKNLKEITFLTVDGSPHCVQLHYASEDVQKVLPHLVINHDVIVNGERKRIEGSKVRRSRHLSEL